jgi:ubiquinone/menaquinone biosynthesis C-methylase UbiE
MESKKFDPKKLEKLNDPGRLTYLNPDLIWPALELSSPEILVDIGAGTGFFAALFIKKLGKGKVYACDISDTMISWMKENLPDEVRDTVIPLKMEESSIPLPDHIADLVYMINLHHEFDEPVKIVKEAYRILRSSGKIMIIDWKKEETPEGPPLSIRVTEDTIESHMLQGGFSHISYHRFLPYHHFVTALKS